MVKVPIDSANFPSGPIMVISAGWGMPVESSTDIVPIVIFCERAVSSIEIEDIEVEFMSFKKTVSFNDEFINCTLPFERLEAIIAMIINI